mmetsp:Transcript_81996/g.219381  ORF Transcript_81996/g.219381 Transcript_81996/m.219381 type:complete len:274 (-) Transcript_81996:737-1558(-)
MSRHQVQAGQPDRLVSARAGAVRAPLIGLAFDCDARRHVQLTLEQTMGLTVIPPAPDKLSIGGLQVNRLRHFITAEFKWGRRHIHTERSIGRSLHESCRCQSRLPLVSRERERVLIARNGIRRRKLRNPLIKVVKRVRVRCLGRAGRCCFLAQVTLIVEGLQQAEQPLHSSELSDTVRLRPRVLTVRVLDLCDQGMHSTEVRALRLGCTAKIALRKHSRLVALGAAGMLLVRSTALAFAVVSSTITFRLRACCRCLTRNRAALLRKLLISLHF